jgi:hypothetical protein
LTQGTAAEVKVTYPCSLAIWGLNLLPGCTITAQLYEITQ